MEIPNEIGSWEMPDTIQVPDGYDMTFIPDLTRDNFNKLIEEHNKLVIVARALCERLGIEGDA